MTEPIKPVGWLVLDPEGGYEYGCMDPDIGRDFCHQHIKDAQESGIPRARKWLVRESFSRDQVERATAELRAEVDALKRRLGQHDSCNGVMGESGYVPECISMRAEVERLRADGERLDWLAANPREGSIRIGTDMKPVVFWGVSAAPGVDLRFAIDAALKEPK